MSFNPSIPLITDPILQSAAQIKANFQAVNSAFGDNHYGLTQDEDEFQGMHNLLTLRPTKSGDPATSATQTALYNKVVGSIPQLFYRPNSIQTPIQMTYPSIKSDLSNTQYSFVAGPFIIYGGFIAAVTNGQVITLSPGTMLLYVDMIVSSQPSLPLKVAQVVPTSISGTSFTATYQTTTGTYDVFYFAIGL